MTHRKRPIFGLQSAFGMLFGVMAVPAACQQVPDTAFAPSLGAPEYPAGQGPMVLIDAAHLNFHTADGSYLTFARFLERDGYRIRSLLEAFSQEELEHADVLVIANAMHEQSWADWAPLPSHSAFSNEEIAAVEQWVREGGSLFLIADHMPLAGHAEALAAEFGIRFLNGFALDEVRRGRITYRRSDGSLPSSSITNGREPFEVVDSVTTFTGQAFRVDPDVNAVPILVLRGEHTLYLPQVAFEFSDSTPRISAVNLLQGVAVIHGQGRVAVIGEAAAFSAQLAGPQMAPMGMNDPGAGQNHLLLLNLMHWLSGRLD